MLGGDVVHDRFVGGPVREAKFFALFERLIEIVAHHPEKSPALVYAVTAAS